MRERIDCTPPQQLIPIGRYKLTIIGRPEKRRTASGKGTFRIWKIRLTIDGRQITKTILLFPWESIELLRALGAEEVEPNVFEWEDELVDGKQVVADIIHVKGKDGKAMEKLKNVKAVDIGISEAKIDNNFFSSSQSMQPNDNINEDVAWDE